MQTYNIIYDTPAKVNAYLSAHPERFPFLSCFTHNASKVAVLTFTDPDASFRLPAFVGVKDFPFEETVQATFPDTTSYVWTREGIKTRFFGTDLSGLPDELTFDYEVRSDGTMILKKTGGVWNDLPENGPYTVQTVEDYMGEFAETFATKTELWNSWSLTMDDAAWKNGATVYGPHRSYGFGDVDKANVGTASATVYPTYQKAPLNEDGEDVRPRQQFSSAPPGSTPFVLIGTFREINRQLSGMLETYDQNEVYFGFEEFEAPRNTGNPLFYLRGCICPIADVQ